MPAMDAAWPNTNWRHPQYLTAWSQPRGDFSFHCRTAHCCATTSRAAPQVNNHAQRAWLQFTPERRFNVESANEDTYLNRSLGKLGMTKSPRIRLQLVGYDSVISSVVEKSIRKAPRSGSTLTMPTGHGFPRRIKIWLHWRNHLQIIKRERRDYGKDEGRWRWRWRRRRDVM